MIAVFCLGILFLNNVVKISCIHSSSGFFVLLFWFGFFSPKASHTVVCRVMANDRMGCLILTNIQVDSSFRLVINSFFERCNSFFPFYFHFLVFSKLLLGGEERWGKLGQSFPAAALALRKGGRKADW